MRMYRGMIIPQQVEFYEKNPNLLARDVFSAFGSLGVPANFIHELNKVLYNNGESTTKLFKSEKDEDGQSIAFTHFVNKLKEGHREHKHDIVVVGEIPIEYYD